MPLTKFSLLTLFVTLTLVTCVCRYATRPPNSASRHVNFYPFRTSYEPNGELRITGMSANEREKSAKYQAALFRSPFVIRAALRPRPVQHLFNQRKYEKPVEWVSKNLRIEPMQGQFVGEVSLTSYDFKDKDLRLILDAMCDAYMNEMRQH